MGKGRSQFSIYLKTGFRAVTNKETLKDSLIHEAFDGVIGIVVSFSAAGTYSNRVVYSVIGTIPVNISSVTVSVGGESVENLQAGEANTIVVTTDLMTSELGTPRVYLTTTNPAGTTECGNANVVKNSQGYVTITCVATPSAAATGVTLHITQGSSGNWKWGDFAHALPDVVTPVPYMQNFTTSQCASMAQGEQIQLVDSRDNKTYWVGKLTDGNCWMTQNLDLDLSTSKVLTPDDSDVSSNWTPSVSTTTSIFKNSINNSQYSWDPGMYVKTNPDDYNTYCNDVTTINGCDGWQSVSGMTPMADGTTNTAISGNTYNAHYLVGNYYQWVAATAGTGRTATHQDVTDSICPKGWQLPTSNNSTSGSFQALVGSLNITTLTQSPYFFLLSGRVIRGVLENTGSRGNYWSSTADYSTSVAKILHIYSGGVSWNGSYARYIGFPVRCVATQ